jgi:hypothetical protein
MTAGSEPVRLPTTPRIADEVHDLHRRTVDIAQHGRQLGRRRFRRELREAKQAEADLLRVLGFDDYGGFLEANDGQHDRVESNTPSSDRTTPSTVVDIDLTKDAKETEERLRRVLERVQQARSGEGAEERVDELFARVGALDEELAEARFTLSRLRDGAKAATLDVAVTGAVDGLVNGLREVRVCLELALAERAEAERLRVAAAAEAQRLLEAARADAVALTREALAIVDRLTRRVDDGPAI